MLRVRIMWKAQGRSLGCAHCNLMVLAALRRQVENRSTVRATIYSCGRTSVCQPVNPKTIARCFSALALFMHAEAGRVAEGG
jgi:hypothetical protein